MLSKNTRLALVGLPNVGKTTLFNKLAGTYYKTGNWSGVTVKEHIHACTVAGQCYEVADLPGILSVYDDVDQLDSQLTRQALSSANLIVNVVDGRFIHRDLILTLQLLLYQKPQVVVLTHVDEMVVSMDKVCEAMPCKVLTLDEINLDMLVECVGQVGVFDFEQIIEWPVGFDTYWEQLSHLSPLDRLECLVTQENSKDVQIAEGFYQTAATLIDRSGCRQIKEHKSSNIDHWVLDKLYGLPIFLLVMYSVFSVTIGIGGALGDGVMQLCIWFLQVVPVDTLLGVTVYSIGTGFATCFGFIPILAVMYILLGLLEQSGYLSRVALLADMLMKPIGLSGHSFIPMILGFGCNVPAIMATRVVAGKQQRMLTALMLPFMPCTARLSIFAVFAASFFPQKGALIIMMLYLMGIMMGIGTTWIVSYILGKGADNYLSISLPDYQVPRLKDLMFSARLKVIGFIKKALPYIVIFSGVLGFLGVVDLQLNIVAADISILASVGKKVAHLFYFMGIGEDNWQAVVALLSGMVAKEVVITTLNSLYQISGDVVGPLTFSGIIWDTVSNILAFPFQMFFIELGDMDGYNVYQQYFSQSAAFSYMVFVLLYFPCVSTLVALQTEFGSSIAAFAFIWTTALAIWVSKISYWGFGVIDMMLLCMLFLCIRYIRVRNDTAAT